MCLYVLICGMSELLSALLLLGERVVGFEALQVGFVSHYYVLEDLK